MLSDFSQLRLWWLPDFRGPKNVQGFNSVRRDSLGEPLGPRDWTVSIISEIAKSGKTILSCDPDESGESQRSRALIPCEGTLLASL